LGAAVLLGVAKRSVEIAAQLLRVHARQSERISLDS
jgi:hypothetical protein